MKTLPKEKDRISSPLASSFATVPEKISEALTAMLHTGPSILAIVDQIFSQRGLSLK
jgi:hypothetical protein